MPLAVRIHIRLLVEEHVLAQDIKMRLMRGEAQHNQVSIEPTDTMPIQSANTTILMRLSLTHYRPGIWIVTLL